MFEFTRLLFLILVFKNIFLFRIYRFLVSDGISYMFHLQILAYHTHLVCHITAVC